MIQRIITSLFISLVCGAALGSIPSPAHAQVVFSDDFSQGLSKWASPRNNSQFWSIVDGQAQAHIPFGSTVTELIPLDQYWDPAWQNLDFEFEFTPLDGLDKNLSFGFIDPLNWYEAHFADTFINIVRVKAGQAGFFINVPYQMQNGRSYHTKIRFDQGHIMLWLDHQLVADTVDWSFNDNYGKVGLKATTGSSYPTTVRYDNVKVTLLGNDNPGLAVPLLKQNDSQWAAQEYDSAKSWSQNPTIAAWGCALTSMVMMLQYHGIHLFPDGRIIDPASLNAWLQQQPDGYLNGGALNWLAVTRLTKQISDRYQTPKLEYRRLAGYNPQAVKTEIEAERPVILELPGHFVVGSGWLENDLAIKDPAYDRNKLSQHSHSVLSTRLFKPSYTDLSYLLFTYPAGTNITITPPPGANSPEQFTEQLSDPSTAHSSPLTNVTTVMQPHDGKYLVTVKKQQLSPVSVTVFTYQADGTLKKLLLEGTAGPQGINFELQYQKQAPTAVTPSPITWQRFREDIVIVSRAHGFKHISTPLLLGVLSYRAEQHPLKVQRQTVKVLQELVKVHSKWITPTAKTYLQQQLEALNRGLK